MNPEEARVIYDLGKDARDWKVELAQKDLKESGPDKERITPILYRPFDIRYTYFTGVSRGFHCMPRSEVMKNMLHQNLGLITRRQMLPPYSYVFVSDLITSDGVIRSDNKGGESVFPLYTYSEDQAHLKKEHTININVLQSLSSKYGKEVRPEQVFYYVYAVLHSNRYRERYAEFLKSDFPHIPFVKDYVTFEQLSTIGKELANLHLMKVRLPSLIKFDIQGSNVVRFARYENRKVYINEEQFFDGVAERTWSFYIGAYQVLDKWLKSRKSRQLSSGEIEQFIQIVEIIQRTIEYMERIDKISFF
jgi:predicted helicase